MKCTEIFIHSETYWNTLQPSEPLNLWNPINNILFYRIIKSVSDQVRNVPDMERFKETLHIKDAQHFTGLCLKRKKDKRKIK